MYADDIAFIFDPGDNVELYKSTFKEHLANFGLMINDAKCVDISG